MAEQSSLVPRVLVFGATGKVGSEVCKLLTSASLELECHAFTRNITQGRELLGSRVIFHQGDLSDIETVKDVMVSTVQAFVGSLLSACNYFRVTWKLKSLTVS
jgi:uncharacterized protein YbjT (DUF2867 family)